jgi:hypothetical protein
MHVVSMDRPTLRTVLLFAGAYLLNGLAFLLRSPIGSREAQ